jgi:hypothetical protein
VAQVVAHLPASAKPRVQTPVLPKEKKKKLVKQTNRIPNPTRWKNNNQIVLVQR